MNNNNYQANALVSTTSGLSGANQPKAFYSRVRLFGNDVSFVSFTTLQGESNNAGTMINGRGKGRFDRYGIDFRYASKTFPGFMVWLIRGSSACNTSTSAVLMLIRLSPSCG